jgi:GTP-binding protein
MARPVIAIVGRPNVGKSTLFNRLIGERRALMHDQPGTTRDRLYGTCEWRGREVTVIDTGGIGLETGEGLLADITTQAQEAMDEADVIVFLVDAQAGMVTTDIDVAERLRRSPKPVILAANKADGLRQERLAVEFFELGLGPAVPISAIQGSGTGDLLDEIYEHIHDQESPTDESADVSIAIVGRPNVGKSSIVNALLGRTRSIVSDMPGTTRDAIDTEFKFHGKRVLLIDTAGIRRRGRIERGVEKFSVLRAIRAIERAEVAVLVIDASQGLTAQDTHVAGYVDEAKKGLIVAVNKWDLVEKDTNTADEYTRMLRRDLAFADWAPVVFISALTGQRVSRLIDMAITIDQERARRIPTPELMTMARDAFARTPRTEKGRALKLLYCTQAATRPPTFVFFVNDAKLVHFSYQRYLENQIREKYGFEGTGIRLVFRGRGEKD